MYNKTLISITKSYGNILDILKPQEENKTLQPQVKETKFDKLFSKTIYQIA